LSSPVLPETGCPDDWPTVTGDLSGKVVLIAGATGGLGAAFARHAASSGAEVVLVGRRVAALERLHDDIDAAGGKVALYPLNLAGAGPDDYAQMAGQIRVQCGRLDAIVVASAHLRGLTSIERTPPDDWLAALHVNVSAPFLMIQSCLPLLRERTRASIVLVVNGPQSRARAYWGGYGVAQAGLAQFAAILADELENTAIDVVAVDPGPMRTGLRQRVWFTEDPATVPTPERAVDVIAGLLGEAGVGYRGKLLRLPDPMESAPA
jgi:NAD(P)-dependent dehydrogenase (short-subunit alcohol dehydrogenase family)